MERQLQCLGPRDRQNDGWTDVPKFAIRARCGWRGSALGDWFRRVGQFGSPFIVLLRANLIPILNRVREWW